jgi:hypothetical protein
MACSRLTLVFILRYTSLHLHSFYRPGHSMKNPIINSPYKEPAVISKPMSAGFWMKFWNFAVRSVFIFPCRAPARKTDSWNSILRTVLAPAGDGDGERSYC